jgi:hypothetical protein
MAKEKSKPVGRPRRSDKDNKTVAGSERGTLPGEKRRGYIVNESLAGKIDATAYWDRIKIKDAVNNAFAEYLANWEKKNGPVKPVPR